LQVSKGQTTGAFPLAILEHDYPSIEDLRRRAKRRIPHFAWEYLDSGTGEETALDRNRQTLDAVTFSPRALRGRVAANLETSFLGREYSCPIGIAPVGATGMMWPGTEADLARFAQKERVPYGLSTVATRTPDEIGPISFQMMTRPSWLMGIAKHGQPRFRLMEDYVDSRTVADVAKRLGAEMRPNPDWSVIDDLRRVWDGHIFLKGICNVEDAVQARDAGIDAVWVSNHGGRQLDAAPGAMLLFMGQGPSGLVESSWL